MRTVHSRSTPTSLPSSWTGSGATAPCRRPTSSRGRSIDWYWRPTNQVRAILEALAESGILGLTRREGNRRIYDLAERLFPADLLAERRPVDEQRQHKVLSRYRAHGLLAARGGQQEIWVGTGRSGAERAQARGALIESAPSCPSRSKAFAGSATCSPRNDRPWMKPPRRSRPASRTGRGVAFLAPLDPIVWDRDLLRSLWDFDYVWEVYVPAAKRRWGYYVLPLLWGDRFVGRIEPRIERQTGTVKVIDVWWEDGFDPLADDAFVDAFADALSAYRDVAGARRISWPRMARHRGLGARVRDRLRA